MTQPWMPRFVTTLARTGNVSKSAKAAKISRQAAYLQRDTDALFRAAWDEALEVAADALEEEARRRAAEGVQEPVFYQGEQVATVRKYSDTLLIFLLKAARPEKFRERTDVTSGGQTIAAIAYSIVPPAVTPESVTE